MQEAVVCGYVSPQTSMTFEAHCRCGSDLYLSDGDDDPGTYELKCLDSGQTVSTGHWQLDEAA